MATVKELRATAASYGIKGYSRMNKAELDAAIHSRILELREETGKRIAEQANSHAQAQAQQEQQEAPEIVGDTTAPIVEQAQDEQANSMMNTRDILDTLPAKTIRHIARLVKLPGYSTLATDSIRRRLNAWIFGVHGCNGLRALAIKLSRTDFMEVVNVIGTETLRDELYPIFSDEKRAMLPREKCIALMENAIFRRENYKDMNWRNLPSEWLGTVREVLDRRDQIFVCELREKEQREREEQERIRKRREYLRQRREAEAFRDMFQKAQRTLAVQAMTMSRYMQATPQPLALPAVVDRQEQQKNIAETFEFDDELYWEYFPNGIENAYPYEFIELYSYELHALQRYLARKDEAGEEYGIAPEPETPAVCTETTPIAEQPQPEQATPAVVEYDPEFDEDCYIPDFQDCPAALDDVPELREQVQPQPAVVDEGISPYSGYARPFDFEHINFVRAVKNGHVPQSVLADMPQEELAKLMQEVEDMRKKEEAHLAAMEQPEQQAQEAPVAIVEQAQPTLKPSSPVVEHQPETPAVVQKVKKSLSLPRLERCPHCGSKHKPFFSYRKENNASYATRSFGGGVYREWATATLRCRDCGERIYSCFSAPYPTREQAMKFVCRKWNTTPNQQDNVKKSEQAQATPAVSQNVNPVVVNSNAFAFSLLDNWPTPDTNNPNIVRFELGKKYIGLDEHSKEESKPQRIIRRTDNSIFMSGMMACHKFEIPQGYISVVDGVEFANVAYYLNYGGRYYTVKFRADRVFGDSNTQQDTNTETSDIQPVPQTPFCSLFDTGVANPVPVQPQPEPAPSSPIVEHQHKAPAVVQEVKKSCSDISVYISNEYVNAHSVICNKRCDLDAREKMVYQAARYSTVPCKVVGNFTLIKYVKVSRRLIIAPRNYNENVGFSDGTIERFADYCREHKIPYRPASFWAIDEPFNFSPSDKIHPALLPSSKPKAKTTAPAKKRKPRGKAPIDTSRQILICFDYGAPADIQPPAPAPRRHRKHPKHSVKKDYSRQLVFTFDEVTDHNPNQGHAA